MPLLFQSSLFLDLAVQCPCVSFPGLSLLFLCLSALHVSISSPIRAMPVPDYSVPTHYIFWLCLCFSKPSYAFPFLCYSRQLHTSAKPNISAAMHFFSLPSPFKADQCRYRSVRCISIPQPCDSNQYRYLKIVVGLWLISCQKKAPFPELRHCPRPLNRP